MDYDKLPEGLRGGAERYVEQGIEPGSFLLACFENDLVGAFDKADHENSKLMLEIVSWLYEQCPHRARGSAAAVAAWMKRGGLAGITA